MDRRTFLAASAATAATPLMIASGQSAKAQDNPSDAAERGPLIASPPVVQNATGSGFTVAWQVAGPATGWVEWGYSDQLGQRGACASRPGKCRRSFYLGAYRRHRAGPRFVLSGGCGNRAL